MVKKLFSVMMAMIIVISLAPITALAAEAGGSSDNPIHYSEADKENFPAYGSEGEVAIDKSALWNDENNKYATVILEAKGTPIKKNVGVDVLLVLDHSSSMNACAECGGHLGKDEHGERCLLCGTKHDNKDSNRCSICRMSEKSHANNKQGHAFSACTAEMYSPCKGEQNRLAAIKASAGRFVESLLSEESDNRIGIIKFDENPTTLTEDFLGVESKGTLQNIVSAIKLGSGTNYSDSLQMAKAVIGARSDTARPVYVIFMSDGEPFDGDTNRDHIVNYANELKKDCEQLFTIGFAVDKNSKAEVLMQNMGQYYGAHSSADIEGILSALSSVISAPAATETFVEDIVGNDFNLAAAPKFEKLVGGQWVDASADITVAPDGRSFIWKIGTLAAEGISLRYIVELEAGKANGVYPTNVSADIVYKNFNDNWCQKDFPIPQLPVPGGAIRVVFYKVNAEGKPVDSEGTALGMTASDIFSRGVVLSDSYIKEGSSPTLIVNKNYDVAIPSSVTGGYVKSDKAGTLFKITESNVTPENYSPANSASVTESVSNKAQSKTIFAGYYLVPTLRVNHFYGLNNSNNIVGAETPTNAGTAFAADTAIKQNTVPGYKLQSVTIKDKDGNALTGASATLVAAAILDGAGGEVTGAMPDKNVVIEFKYAPAKAKITIVKVDESGKTLDGAAFTANNENILGTNGEFVFEATYGQEYTIAESKTPDMYIGLAASFVVKLGANLEPVLSGAPDGVAVADGKVLVTNKLRTGTIQINKVGSDGKALDGAAFTANGTEMTAGADGVFTITANYGVEYEIVETKTPVGHQSIASFKVKLDKDGKPVGVGEIPSGITFDSSKKSVTVQNKLVNDLSYTVEHYYVGETAAFETAAVTGVTYGTEVKTVADSAALKEGYVRTKAETLPATITANGTVIKVYYALRSDLSYTVEHYYVGETKAFETVEVTGVTYGTNVETVADSAALKAGYVRTKAETLPATITANGTVIKVYYAARSDLSYTVEHYYVGEATAFETAEVTGVAYGTEIQTVADSAALKEGYVRTKAETLPATITANGTVIKVYYAARSDLSYTVEHYYVGETTAFETVEVTGVAYGTEIQTVADSAKLEPGYARTKAETLPATITANGTVIKVYYDAIIEYTLDVEHVYVGANGDGTDLVVADEQKTGLHAKDTGTVNTVGMDGYVCTEADGENLATFLKHKTEEIVTGADFKMGASNAKITFTYNKVSYPLTVKHVFEAAGETIEINEVAYVYGSEVSGNKLDESEYGEGREGYGYVDASMDIAGDKGIILDSENGSFSGTMPGSPVVITFNYTAKKDTIRLEKRDLASNDMLPGAEFTVNTVKFAEGYSSYSFKGIYGSTFEITEDMAPAGYEKLTETFYVTFSNDGVLSLSDADGIEISNEFVNVDAETKTITVYNRRLNDEPVSDASYQISYHYEGEESFDNDEFETPKVVKSGTVVGANELQKLILVNEFARPGYRYDHMDKVLPLTIEGAETIVINVYYKKATVAPSNGIEIFDSYYTNGKPDAENVQRSGPFDVNTFLTKDGKLSLNGQNNMTRYGVLDYGYTSMSVTGVLVGDPESTIDIAKLTLELEELRSELAKKELALGAFVENNADITNALALLLQRKAISAEHDVSADLAAKIEEYMSSADMPEIGNQSAPANGAAPANEIAPADAEAAPADGEVPPADAEAAPADGEVPPADNENDGQNTITLSEAEQRFIAAVKRLISESTDEELKAKLSAMIPEGEAPDMSVLDYAELSHQLQALEDEIAAFLQKYGYTDGENLEATLNADSTDIASRIAALEKEIGNSENPEEGSLNFKVAGKIAEIEAAKGSPSAISPEANENLELDYDGNYFYTVTFRYDRKEEPKPLPDPDPDPDPRPNPDPDPDPRPDPDRRPPVVPRKPATPQDPTVTIPDAPVPLAPAPNQNLYTILDGNVPLGNLPTSGGKSGAIGLIGLLSLLAGFLFGRKKNDDDDDD